MDSHQLAVVPLTGAMGAEIHGVDLARLDDKTFSAAHQVLLDYGVIFFRNQNITPMQQMAFAKRWGNVHLHPHMPCLADHPGIIEIIKKEDDTTVFGANWHTDQMFTPTPARYTLLYAKQVPPVGGDTLFANLYMAYDTLSEGMKNLIADLHTISIYDKKKKRPAAMKPTAPEVDAQPAEHPLVRQHPETGRKALYLCHIGITRQIAGMTEEESKPLLTYLFNHATKPEFTCRFRWAVGSMAIWDNRRALHYPVNDYYGYRRVMHRITIEGERTF
ncbi:MAG: taurine dioxygenase [Betaproteobacteria bacterium]|nr:taurine dioxygenase [Betaproteobacteria bacterium]